MNTKGILAFGRLLFSRKPVVNTLSNITEAQWSKLSQSIFRQANEPKSSFLKYLNEFKTSGLDIPEDVQKALSILEQKATIFADRMDRAVARGSAPAPKNYFEGFKKQNKEQFDVIEKYLKKHPQLDKLYSDIVCEPNKILGHFDLMYCGKIAQTDANVFSSNQIFYHGTKHPQSIIRNGFKTEAKWIQKQKAARELGDAVYLTPDREVAASFAGLLGGILKTSVSNLRAASINNRQLNNIVPEIFKQLGKDVDIEQVMKELFKRNGFNAAYSRKGLSVGLFSEPIDPLIGKAQSQLAVYNTKDITILPRTLSERIGNIKLQFKARYKMDKYIFNLIKDMIKNTNLSKRINKFMQPYVSWIKELKLPKEIRKQIVSKSDIKQYLNAEAKFYCDEISAKEFKQIKDKLIKGRIIKGKYLQTIYPDARLSQEELYKYFKNGCIVDVYSL